MISYAITGGTGSLGQALTRHLLTDPTCGRIVILSRDEVKQAQMAQSLTDPHDKLRFFLGDVRDEARLVEAFHHTSVVIHTAALKRVDAVAYSPAEARKTNVEGSANVVRAAVKAGVVKVLMTSSDKAVEPTNFYGVSKQMMEQEAIASNAYTYPQGTRVSCTRWGNVIGSRGSVVHVFRQCVREGRPLPLTDPRCTRFWLTLGDAVRYVMAALDLMEGGEVFVPRDLLAARLLDVADAIAPGGGIITTGLRPGGEKLHEVLMTAEEGDRAVHAGVFYAIRPHLHPWRSEWPGDWVGVGERYASDRVLSMTVEEIRKMLERLDG